MDEAKLKSDLLNLIQEKSVIKGKFKLASGKESNFYIDGRRVTLDPQGIYLIGKIVLGMIHGQHIDAIGGPTIGADPIASAVALLSSQSGHPIKGFIVRKETKRHGTQRQIEGPNLEPGDKVVLVEDVVTSGGSALDAIKAIEATKAKVVKVICLVDREAGAAETLAAYNYTPIFTLSDLKV